MHSRDDQRVYFANTPWWVPMLVVAVVIFGSIGLAMTRQAAAPLDPAVEELTDAVQRYRDGQHDDALAELETTTVVTSNERSTSYARETADGGCWAVRVGVTAGRDGIHPIAGPLPASADACDPDAGTSTSDR